MKVYRGSRGIAPLILNLGIGCRWVVSFNARPLYPQETTAVPTEQEAGWTLEPLWNGFGEKGNTFYKILFRHFHLTSVAQDFICGRTGYRFTPVRIHAYTKRAVGTVFAFFLCEARSSIMQWSFLSIKWNTRCDQKISRLGEWKLQFIANV